MLAAIRRHLRLYRVFWANSLAREAEFRANFWANVVLNTGWLLFFVAFIKIIYWNVPRIADWTEPEALALTGTYGLVQGVFGVVAYANLSRLPELVRLGTLDFFITKPVNAQFLVSTRLVRLESIGNVLGSLFVVLYAAVSGGLSPGWREAGAYLYLTACALAIYYGAYLLVMTLSFWFVRIENLAVLCDMVFHIGRYPIDIFRDWTRRVFVYVIPLAFVASFPTRALFGKLGPEWLVLGTLFAVGLNVAAALFWRFGLRNYASASS